MCLNPNWYILCKAHSEDKNYIFISYPIAQNLWDEVEKLISWPNNYNQNLWSPFALYNSASSNKRTEKALSSSTLLQLFYSLLGWKGITKIFKLKTMQNLPLSFGKTSVLYVATGLVDPRFLLTMARALAITLNLHTFV